MTLPPADAAPFATPTRSSPPPEARMPEPGPRRRDATPAGLSRPARGAPLAFRRGAASAPAPGCLSRRPEGRTPAGPVPPRLGNAAAPAGSIRPAGALPLAVPARTPKALTPKAHAPKALTPKAGAPKGRPPAGPADA